MDKAAQDEAKRRFGARLRTLRKARKMSQEAVALAAGLDRSYLGRIERGEVNVSLVNIERIAAAIGVGVRELFAD